MKKIFLIITAMCLIFTLAAVGVSATETEVITETEAVTWTEAVTETEVITETEVTTAVETLYEVESGEAADIVDIISKAESKADAIFAVAEKLGISYEDAEGLVNSVLALGDKYLGENAGWVRFKEKVIGNMEFWAIVAVIALVALALLWCALSNHIKNRRFKNVEFNISEVSATAAEAKDINSQTLAKLLEMVEESRAKEAEHKQYIEELVKKITELKEENVEQDKERIKTQRDILTAMLSALRMEKLICDRTRMPMADKATIDHFYATGVDPLLSNLPVEDAKAVEELAKTLDTVGAGDEK